MFVVFQPQFTLYVRDLILRVDKAEEAPSALLLAQAALLSNNKKAFRRAALWYMLAANRLEKCGIVRSQSSRGGISSTLTCSLL
jgi:hypothetical protein